MATRSPSSPSASPPSATPLPTAAATSAAKKPHPVPWTHEETVNLIRAYEEKWYALKRGPLKSSQWEEVAVTVAARCGYSYAEPSKTATQCRHKMEKLRKRYRAEKQRAGAASGWPYYEMMERLERGPMPISARPIAVVPYGARRAVGGGIGGDEEEEEEEEAADEEEEEDNEDEEYDGNYSKSRSINHILRRPAMVNRFPRASASAAAGGAKRKRAAEKMEEEEEEAEEEGWGERRRRKRRAVWEMAGEIRGFAERYVGMENVKMEMMRESERWRMDFERKRMDLIAESQSKILDTIAKAFCFPS
ncbi:trihelix transcription factor ASIL1 [Eucalyptus grandis]|uniref:trihelix transcription factor ASIL1 n=1 Tax=Eucalyptus grandis TaxID=71139 RepID=UPI00192EAF56|nr:trihelix transcription factor ASIL1 [Eucalyptus grandis]